MTVEKEDLGLSLRLSFPENRSSLQLNLMPPSSSRLRQPTLVDFPSFDRNLETCRVETRSLLEGIDVNRLPSTIDCEEEAGVSYPNSTISSINGKRSEREEPNGDDLDLDLDLERAPSRGLSDEEEGDTSKRLGLRPRQVEVWFQNRRARTKLKQTEVDCEFLKRCCENLTEENRRLQKEVQELRALKLSPQFYMQINQPTPSLSAPFSLHQTHFIPTLIITIIFLNLFHPLSVCGPFLPTFISFICNCCCQRTCFPH